MSKIKQIRAREILNTKGEPTLETTISLTNGLEASASVPSGSSIGSYEAVELNDGDTRRYFGLGKLQAITKVEEIIAPALQGYSISDQEKIDQRLISLDDTSNKSNLGANAILSVSLATARLAAKQEKLPLYRYLQKKYQFKEAKIPVPLFNIFNGGLHADTNLDFQEFLLIPKRASANEMIRQGAEIFHYLGEELKKIAYDTDVGLEGGYAPDLDSSIEAIELILAGGIRAGYQAGTEFSLGVDVGSTVLYDQGSGKYVFSLDNAHFQAQNLINLYEDWLLKYPITYLEDPLAEDDIENWQELSKRLGARLSLAGDDLLATNSKRLRLAIDKKIANTVVVKPNQVGTLTETIDYIKLALQHNYRLVVSHRSAETNDDFIVDLAVACGAHYLKAGSLSRGERVAKYNRLLAIASELEK